MYSFLWKVSTVQVESEKVFQYPTSIIFPIWSASLLFDLVSLASIKGFATFICCLCVISSLVFAASQVYHCLSFLDAAAVFGLGRMLYDASLVFLVIHWKTDPIKVMCHPSCVTRIAWVLFAGSHIKSLYFEIARTPTYDVCLVHLQTLGDSLYSLPKNEQKTLWPLYKVAIKGKFYLWSIASWSYLCDYGSESRASAGHILLHWVVWCTRFRLSCRHYPPLVFFPSHFRPLVPLKHYVI